MQEEGIEQAICRIANIQNIEAIDTSNLLDAVVNTFSVSKEDAYLLAVAARLLNRYRKAGSDIDKI